MATVTDTLETVFVLKGAEQLIRNFDDLGRKSRELAQEKGRLLNRTEQLGLAFDELTGGPIPFAAAAITALGAALSRAAAIFAEDEQAIFRTTVVLRNMGSSLPIEELRQFSSELQRNIAVDDEAVVAVGGLLARFGVAGTEIPETLRTIVDASEATGLSLDQVGQAVGRGIQGQTRGLRALGIQYRATGDELQDLIAIRTELERRFGGAGEARRDTLAGAFTALAESFNNLFSAFGERLAPLMITVANRMVVLIDFLTANVEHLIRLFAFMTGGPAAVILAEQAIQESRGRNPAARIGGANGPQPATEGTQQEIAENTRQIAGSLGRFLVGGGAAARGALNVRGLNAALRAGR